MDAEDLAARVIAGERRALARAITVVESTREVDRGAALTLGERAAATGRQAIRIGLTGTPGVGKSTFIEAFGLMLTGQGLRVAVLAVDPTSARSGGSILGDKTRMERLSRDRHAFIRPSPSQTTLGGVARRTREVVGLCEGAGFDVVLVETVGVGQSETMVADLSDLFVLLMAPGGGDELQGVKRGIMELADLILVNKADGEMRAGAERTRGDYAGALRLMRARAEDPEGFPKALCVSALTGEGIGAAWADMQALVAWRRAEGHLARRRADQARRWFEAEVREALLATLQSREDLREAMARVGQAVGEGKLSAARGLQEVLPLILGR